MPRKIRDYKDEYQKYHSTTKAKKDRAKRNSARAAMQKAGKVRKGQDVDHKKPLSKGGSNKKSNLQVMAASKNRSFKRNSKGGIK